jgi:hypothetical protein
MVGRYLLIAVALALSGCAATTASATTPTSSSEIAPEQGYLLQASDNSWYLFIQVQNGVGTADSAVYEPATNSVSVQHGTATLSNGLLQVAGISNNSWFATGCDCQYQSGSGGGLLVSISTTTGIQQWTAVSTDVSTYNAGVTALNAEASAAISSAAAAANAAAQASAAAAASAAQASAAAAAAAQAILDREQATCKRNAGTSSTSFGNYVCTVGYRSPADGQTYQYGMAFDENGNVVPDSCQDNGYAGSNCSTNPETAAQARADCLNGSFNSAQGYWHPATDICSL